MRYGGKMAAVSAAMGCGALLVGAGPASAVPAASASQPWGAAIQVPGLALLPHYGGSVQTRAVSCASPGNCSAVGNYDDTSGDRQAFVASEVHGTWQPLVEVLSTEFLSDENAEVLSISCPSAGNCAIGGDYIDGPGHRQAYVGSERNGAWEASLEVPGTPALNGGGNAQVASVSCASAGNCAAGGYYLGGGGHREAFVVSEKNATWSGAKEVAGALNTNGFAEVNSISCPTVGNCGAGGLYDAKTHGGLTEGFVVSDKNGTWSAAQEVAGKLNGGGDGSGTSVSCRAAGYCTAGGYYLSGLTGGKYESFVVSQTKGIWGSAGEVPGTGALNAGGEAGSVVVSCASAGNCAVTGDYQDKAHHTQAFITGSAGGRCAVAEAIPGSVGLDKGGDASPLSVSCASAASCAVGGAYDATPSFALGFVASGALPQMSRTPLTLSAASVTFSREQSERITVTVSAQRSGKPSGTVTVAAGGTVLCAFALNSAGKGSCTLSAKRLSVGKHSLAASYGGSVGYSGSGSAAKVVTVVR
jgi:Big-like domain-containing protein